MSIRRVANIGLDGSTVTTTFGKVELRCIKAAYGDKLETAKLSLMGGQTIDEITQGTYATDDLKVTMSSMRFRTEFLPAMPPSGGGTVRMPIVVGRSHPDAGSDSDLLEGCRCTNWGAAVENSNKAEEVELTFVVQQIKWGDERKTINVLGPGVIGAAGF